MPASPKKTLLERLDKAAKFIGACFTSETSQLERQDGERLAKHIFSDDMGLELVKAENGSAEAKLKVTNKHFNGYGLDICHGGVLATACDTVMAWARETLCEAGKVAVNSTMYTRFFKPVKEGTELFFRAAHVDPKKSLDAVSELLVTITDSLGDIKGYAKGEVAIVDKMKLGGV